MSDNTALRQCEETIRALTDELQHLKGEISDLRNAMALNMTALRLLSDQRPSRNRVIDMLSDLLEFNYDALDKNALLLKQLSDFRLEHELQVIAAANQQSSLQLKIHQLLLENKALTATLDFQTGQAKAQSQVQQPTASDTHTSQQSPDRRLQLEVRRLQGVVSELRARNSLLLRANSEFKARASRVEAALDPSGLKRAYLDRFVEKCKSNSR